jgi:arsenite/tail-anchored protein-transporting ATPase
MRVLLFTGKGGVGKTSVAAATALRAADAGRRTLVLSTDPAHSLGDAFDVALGSEPVRVAPRLHAEQIDAQQRLEANWRDIREYLVALLQWGGVTGLEAEELSVLPGLEEIFSLIDIRRHVEAAQHDLLIVDCAPTAETLRLLSLPDALAWYLERVFPLQGKFAKAVRPVLGRVTTMPLPEDAMLGSVERLHHNLDGVRRLLTDGERSSVRLVLNPEKMVIAEARRTYTYLNLFGYHVDAVLVNRLLPDDVRDPWFDGWKAAQAEHLRSVHDSFAPVPVLRAPLFEREPVGVELLRRLGDALYGDAAADAVLHRDDPLRFRTDGAGYVLELALPFVGKGDIDLLARGDELYVKVGAYTRSVLMPAALRRYELAGAAMDGGRLTVRFVPPVLDHALDVPR